MTKYVLWHWIDPQQVIAAKIAFVVSPDDAVFGLLQSSLHEYWALRRGGKFGVGGSFSYSSTACFRSFPFPAWTGESVRRVRELGAEISLVRRQLALRESIGLTEIYNRFHDRNCCDTDIVRLRLLHQRLDEVVAEAYGWSDFDFSREWLSTTESGSETEEGEGDLGLDGDEEWRYSISDSTREAILARLLELNAERALEEKTALTASKQASEQGKKKPAAATKSTKTAAPVGQGNLFGVKER